MNTEAMKFVRHIAGEYTHGLQYCVVCGITLTDHRNAMVPAGQKLNGWPEGDVFVRGNFSTTVNSDEFDDCSKLQKA